ncbi:MAG: galactokinase family protein [Flavobacteriales bacterium]
MAFDPFVSFAPGRVCLFGEHQDYLGLPVIAAAIPLGCRLVVRPRADGVWSFRTPKLGFSWTCHVNDAVSQVPEREPGPGAFLRAGLAEALAAGWDVGCGAEVVAHVDLPVQAGLSSSSAMVVAWVNALARVAGVRLTSMELARQAHRVEVLHFGEPGGHMDHVASALGGIHRIQSDWSVEEFEDLAEGVWVVVDSGEPKDTRGHLTRCKTLRRALVDRHGGAWMAPDSVPRWETMTAEDQTLWNATWGNLSLESQAAREWSEPARLATWMDAHHGHLRDGLGLSTSRLEALRAAALEAGAWGWKVVGSGGGGCGLAWVPSSKSEAVHAAVRQAGAQASWSVGAAPGARCEAWKESKRPAVILAAGKSSRMKESSAVAAAKLTPAQQELLRTRTKAMLPVGENGRPFLAVLLRQMSEEGIDAACVVVSSEDRLTPELLQPWIPEGMAVDFARQTVEARRTKPAGTANAVQRGLERHPEWEGTSVAVCNGDNLPPLGALAALNEVRCGMLGFARSALGLPPERVQAFAVVEGDADAGVAALIEKPTEEQVARAADASGEVWVSMNLFRLPYAEALEACAAVPEHPDRGERELPAAAMLVSERLGGNLQLVPYRGKFVDLTHPEDWRNFPNPTTHG